MLTHFYCSLSKEITSINIIASQIRKIFKNWKTVKLIMVDKGFPNFGILFESLNFIIGNKHFKLFPGGDMLNSFIFERECLPKYSNNCTSVYFSKQYCSLIYSKCAFMHTSHFITQNIKNTYT